MAESSRDRFARARVARLATADARGVPHLVPIVFAVEGDTIYTAVDDKPKRSRMLRRLANVAANPHVAALVDHYAEDWTHLWWVRADGYGRIVDISDAEAAHGIDLLVERYAPYQVRRPAGPVLVIEVARWASWSAMQG